MLFEVPFYIKLKESEMQHKWEKITLAVRLQVLGITLAFIWLPISIQEQAQEN
jgi:hypothetical protein